MILAYDQGFMQSGTRRTLEFDRIALALGRLTQTTLGLDKVAERPTNAMGA